MHTLNKTTALLCTRTRTHYTKSRGVEQTRLFFNFRLAYVLYSDGPVVKAYSIQSNVLELTRVVCDKDTIKGETLSNIRGRNDGSKRQKSGEQSSRTEAF